MQQRAYDRHQARSAEEKAKADKDLEDATRAVAQEEDENRIHREVEVPKEAPKAKPTKRKRKKRALRLGEQSMTAEEKSKRTELTSAQTARGLEVLQNTDWSTGSAKATSAPNSKQKPGKPNVTKQAVHSRPAVRARLRTPAPTKRVRTAMRKQSPCLCASFQKNALSPGSGDQYSSASSVSGQRSRSAQSKFDHFKQTLESLIEQADEASATAKLDRFRQFLRESIDCHNGSITLLESAHFAPTAKLSATAPTQRARRAPNRLLEDLQEL